jgi:hypothetical protein
MSTKDIVAVSEFWAQVARGDADDCWPWTGYSEKGYGRYYWRGRMVGAHELALTFMTGERRARGLETCHSCHNPLCCNPGHLRFDTRQSNVDDMMAAGRSRHAVKLTDEQVVTLRRRALAGATGQTLARDYGVSPSLVTMIIRGERRPLCGGPIRINHGNTKARQFDDQE